MESGPGSRKVPRPFGPATLGVHATGPSSESALAAEPAANLASVAAVAELPNYRFLQADIGDPAAVEAAFDDLQPESVLHFAAGSHVDPSIRGPREFVRTNIEGTSNLPEECRALRAPGEGCSHLVGTDEVHGSLGETGAFNEETPGDPSSPDSASKAASEPLVRAHARTHGMHVTINNRSDHHAS
jgi:dTDP-glucose 4,6-dehydratase